MTYLQHEVRQPDHSYPADNTPSDGWQLHVWYGPDGEHGEYATLAERDIDGSWTVAEFAPSSDAFAVIVAYIEADLDVDDPRDAFAMGTARCADGRDCSEYTSPTLPEPGQNLDDLTLRQYR